MKITIIGMGPGGSEWLPLAAKEALSEAGLCLGAPRLLAALPSYCFAKQQAAIAPNEFMDILNNYNGDNAVLLFSGDTGFFSGAKRLLPLLDNHQVQVLPGISSLQLLAARLGRTWQDWCLASAHGRHCVAANLVRDNATTFFLTGGRQTAGQICADLTAAGFGSCLAVIGENLGYDTEIIHKATVAQLALANYDSLAVLLVDNPKVNTLRSCGFADDDFVRGDIPITKSEIRAVALSKLRLCADDTLYDIGAGTGSVAVEAALIARQGHIYAIERNEEGCKLIDANARRFMVANLHIIHGTAPQVLEGLPVPDAAFIGGSGGQLPQIILYLLGLNPRLRLVISAISLQTLAQATAALVNLPIKQIEIVQVAVSRAQKTGEHHMLKGQNPVFLLSGVGSHE